MIKLLEDEQWARWSDSEVARRCHVSHPFVGRVRASLVPKTSEKRTFTNVLIAMGHRPSIFNGGYLEEMPNRPLSDAERQSVFAVRRKFCEASTALEHVKAECIRRGFVDGRRAA